MGHVVDAVRQLVLDGVVDERHELWVYIRRTVDGLAELQDNAVRAVMLCERVHPIVRLEL